MPKDAKISELTISRSQILEYLGCGYRWDLSFKRGIQTAKVREALDLGDANHRCIKHAVHAYVKTGLKRGLDKVLTGAVMDGAEAWAKDQRQRRGKYLTTETKEQIRALQLESVGIARRGLELIELTDWEVAMWKGKPLAEQEVITPLPPWRGFRTIPDFPARRRKEGKSAPWWMIDWKTRNSFDEKDEINLQFTTMQLVLERELKLEIAGSILWQIKAVAPHPPKLNKPKGENKPEMSRAQIVCDWPLYKKSLIEAGLDPKDYKDMEEKLGQIKWFQAVVEHRSTEECERVWEKIVLPTSARMANDPQVIRRWVNQPFGCSGCWAQEFCMAELFDGDTEFLLETDFIDTRRPRKRRELGDGPKRKFNLKG